MKSGTWASLILLACVGGMQVVAHAANGRKTPVADLAPIDSVGMAGVRSKFLLGCGGCHGERGVSNSKLVPDLRDQVGYFLATKAGRDYVVRLPNVAFNTASSADLADILNFMMRQIGRTSVPAGAQPYTAAEVAELRAQPLTEVSLLELRAQIVEELVNEHNAPPRLRDYSVDRYH